MVIEAKFNREAKRQNRILLKVKQRRNDGKLSKIGKFIGLIKRSKLRENRVDKIMKIIIYKKCLICNV